VSLKFILGQGAVLEEEEKIPTNAFAPTKPKPFKCGEIILDDVFCLFLLTFVCGMNWYVHYYRWLKKLEKNN